MNSSETKHTTSLKLPLAVDLDGLLRDLEHCLSARWMPHYNARDYEGGWESIALRSQDGQSTTVIAHPNGTHTDTELLAECPHFKALLNRIPCEKETVRLLRQAPGGEIKTHRDSGLAYFDGVFRLHIPLVTNAEVEFVVDGKRLPMLPGECWFGDFSAPHSVRNGGATERIHLVIDCVRNAWTDEWFLNAGFDRADLTPPGMTEATRQQVIAALKLLPDATSKSLIAELEAESEAYQSELRLQNMLGFLDEIGIAWRYADVPDDTFLPGLEVADGVILIDKARLRYPGDLLHEAGHIALLPSEKRPLFSGNVAQALPEHEGDELAVILWSYAASLHLGIPVDFVIHDHGYHGNASWLRDQFDAGTFVGLPLLVWMGLCADPKTAAAQGKSGFPEMIRWMR